MEEIRSICRGLILPDIENAGLHEVITRAVDAHSQRTETPVAIHLSEESPELSPSAKICVYRFVQEALNNSFRHGGGIGQEVRQTLEDGSIIVEVKDEGPGFDPQQIRPEGLGLAGLRERIESLGGQFSVKSSDGGTVIRMMIAAGGIEQAQ